MTKTKEIKKISSEEANAKHKAEVKSSTFIVVINKGLPSETIGECDFKTSVILLEACSENGSTFSISEVKK